MMPAPASQTVAVVEDVAERNITFTYDTGVR
jgi:hypothetical protein